MKHNRIEDDIQKEMAAWLELCVPPPPVGPWWTAINPDPAKLGVIAASRLKKMGLKAGTPDLAFVWQGRFIGVEVKAPGKYLSPVQRDTHTAITVNGGIVTTVRSLDDLEGFLKGLDVPMRVTA